MIHRNGAVLHDADADAALERDGFAVIPFLDQGEIDFLRSAYWSSAPAESTGMVIDFMLRDRAGMRRTRELVDPIFERHADALVDQRLVLATFVVKHPGGAESSMFLHDDRSYVDEREHRSSTLWIPLVDVGPTTGNGPLEVVPGSQRLPTGMAGSLTPDLIRPYDSHLRSRLQTVEVAAGSALVYDSRVLHASAANVSDAPREALVLAVAPVGAPLLHVVATGRRHRRVHRIDEQFFIDHHVRDAEVHIGPEYPVVAEFDDDRELTPAQVAAVLGGSEPSPEVVLPGELDDGRPAADRAAFDGSPVRPPVGDVLDLEVAAAELHGGGSLQLRLEVLAGSAAAPAVRRRFRPVEGAALRAVEGRAELPRSAVDADLLVLDPGARVRLDVPSARRWSHHLTVAECPIVASGALAGDRATNFRLDARVTLPPGQATTLWNDGPGPLAVVVSRSPTVLVELRSRLGRLRHRRDRPRRERRNVTMSVRERARSFAEQRAERALTMLLRADERLVNRFAPAVDAPLDDRAPAWSASLRDNWAVIREELDQLVAAGVELPETEELVGYDQGADGRWTTYVMSWYGDWLEATCRRCPRTAQLLRSIPDVQVAGFTVLGPRTRIPRHQGPAKSYRWQLGVRIPGPPGACGLKIGDEVVPWADGVTLAFDDRTPHEAWNDSDEVRYVLFVQVPWPLGGWPGRLHGVAHRVFGAATRRIPRRAAELDALLNPGA